MAIYGCTGCISNYVKISQIEAKSPQKKTDSAVPSVFSEFLKKNNEAKKAATMECITNKIKFGKRLTHDEMEFLKIHNPDLYARAVKIEQEREEYRNALRSCKTKEEARNLQMIRTLQPKLDSDIKMALFDEFTEFVKSNEFEELPSEQELDKEKIFTLHKDAPDINRPFSHSLPRLDAVSVDWLAKKRAAAES